MLQFAIVSDESQKVVEFCSSRETAEAFIADVGQGEPETAAKLRVEPVDFEASLN
jgi:hypothetical protein